jgi:hypothetical protein
MKPFFDDIVFFFFITRAWWLLCRRLDPDDMLVTTGLDSRCCDIVVPVGEKRVFEPKKKASEGSEAKRKNSGAHRWHAFDADIGPK